MGGRGCRPTADSIVPYYKNKFSERHLALSSEKTETDLACFRLGRVRNTSSMSFHKF